MGGERSHRCAIPAPSIRRLAVGAIMVSETREAVLIETQFSSSAGVAHNKVRLVSIQIIFHPLIIKLLCSHLEIGSRYSTLMKLFLSWGADHYFFFAIFDIHMVDSQEGL